MHKLPTAIGIVLYSSPLLPLPLTGTVGKLEALRVSNEGVIENLRSQVDSLQSKLKVFEEEREGLLTSQYTLKEKQAATIKALERVSHFNSCIYVIVAIHNHLNYEPLWGIE